MITDHMLSFTIQMLMLKGMKIFHLIWLVSLFQPYLSSYQHWFFAIVNLQERYCYCCKQHILSMFLDAFQGHYKDGTNETYDWRFLAGLYLTLRIAFVYHVHKHKLLVSNAICPQMQYYFIVTVIVAFVRPYKRLIHNLTETLLLVLIVYMVWNFPAFQRTPYSQEDRIKITVLQLIPHSFLALVIAFKIVKFLFQKLKVRYKGMPIVDKLLYCLGKAWSILSGLISSDEELSSLTVDFPIHKPMEP